jgi:DNA-directed RNA polymerase specialized sigma24 family protein
MEYEYLLRLTVRRNYGLLARLRMDADDMAQELAEILLKAIEDYDPAKGTKPGTYYRAMLQYGVLNLNRYYKRSCRIAGLTAKPLTFINEDGEEAEIDIPYNEDFDGGLFLGEFLGSLSERERGAIDIRMNGGVLAHKHQKAWLGIIRKKLTRFCAMGGGIA